MHCTWCFIFLRLALSIVALASSQVNYRYRYRYRYRYLNEFNGIRSRVLFFFCSFYSRLDLCDNAE